MTEMSNTDRPVYVVVSDNASVIAAAVAILNGDPETRGIVHHRCGCHCANLLIGEYIKTMRLDVEMKAMEEQVLRKDPRQRLSRALRPAGPPPHHV